MLPVRDSRKYPLEDGYWLGFFAAIAIATDGVFIDLNGHTIKQSDEFAARQRFFTIIQLGDKPFESRQGPPQFNKMEKKLRPSNNVIVTGGTLGTSSHMGVHGNNVQNIWVHNVTIRDFETGGVQLNGATHAYVTDTTVGPSSDSVPGLATLSQALLLLRILEIEQPELLQSDKNFRRLFNAVEKYITGDYLGTDSVASLFETPVEKDGSRLPDGSSLYGLLFHKSGLPIHDFLSCKDADKQNISDAFGPIEVRNVVIRDLHLRTDEVVAMKMQRNGTKKTVVGPAGDVFQILRVQEGMEYAGNVLSDAQIRMGQLCNADTQKGWSAKDLFRAYGSTYLPDPVIGWAKGKVAFEVMAKKTNVSYVCNKDSMGHHNKGVMGVRLSSMKKVTMKDVIIKNLVNVGEARKTETAICQGDSATYKGNDVRGIVAMLTPELIVDEVTIDGLHSISGVAHGVEQLHKTKLIGKITIGHLQGGGGVQERATPEAAPSWPWKMLNSDFRHE